MKTKRYTANILIGTLAFLWSIFLLAMAMVEENAVLGVLGGVVFVSAFIALSPAIKENKRRDLERKMEKLRHQNLSPIEYEQYIALYMQNKGYSSVRLTAQTGDFGADVLGIDRKGKRVCVQCKKYSKPVGVKAVQEVIGSLGYYQGERAIVCSNAGYTNAAIQLAKKNNVELYTIE